MIVKNEAANLPRLAVTLKDQIDFWTIVDTGSTDGTMDVARDVFTFAPGQILETQWEGFGPARNVALRAAKPHTEWVMWVDADETLVGQINTDVAPGCNCIDSMEHFMNLRYWMPRLVRGDGWQYKGRAHEYLDHAAPMRVQGQGFYFDHHADGGSRGGKFDRDLPLLQMDWDEQPTGRTAFYIARTYADFGRTHQAITWWKTRLSFPGWDEETFYARYSLGKCLLEVGAYDEGCGNLWASWGMVTQRAEPLVALAEHYRLNNQWALAFLAGTQAYEHYNPRYPGLFMDADMDWRIPYEISISAWYSDHKDWGRRSQGRLLAQLDIIPEPYRTSIQSNQAFYPEVES
jgi:glycosyltransferase involved in cell wall biosynthesis